MFAKQFPVDLMQLCGKTAASNDCEMVGGDFEKIKNALQAIITINQLKIENCKEHFIAGYLEELSSRPNEQPSVEMAEAAFETLIVNASSN